jgi:hypothetical protein
MKVLMKIENGKLILPDHLHLVADEGEVVVDLPPEAVRQTPTAVRKQIDDLLGRYARPRPSTAPDEDKRAWHEHLEEKPL